MGQQAEDQERAEQRVDAGVGETQPGDPLPAAGGDRVVDGGEGGVAGRHGGRRADTFWGLVDRRSESPLETRLRLLLVDAGIPPEQLQWPVRNEVTGVPVARLDLAWPSRLLDVEADGAATHNGATALYRNRHRQNELVGRGWTVLRFTWPDVVHRPEYVIESVRRQLDR